VVNYIGSHKRKYGSDLTDAGAIYFFTRNSSNAWTQTKILTASDPSLYAWFGWSLSFVANYWEYVLLVGASQESTAASNAGAIYIYTCPFANPNLVSDDSGNNTNVLLIGLLVGGSTV
jgi:hypothetical protein